MSCNDQRPFDGLDESRPPASRSSRSTPALAGRTLLLGLALAVGLALGPGPASTPASAHGQGTNGCTGVADSGPGFVFHDACDDHDRCYGRHPYGTGIAGRRTCDQVFRSQMLRYCRRHGHGLHRLSCRVVAYGYHAGVRALGWPFWAVHRPSPIA